MKQQKNKHLTRSTLMANAALPQVIKGKDLQLAERISVKLGETEERAKELIRHIVWVLGADEVVMAMLQISRYEGSWSSPETLAALAEQAQTIPVILVQRPTEKASIFFSLVYTDGHPEEGKELQRPDWLEVVSLETTREEHA